MNNTSTPASQSFLNRLVTALTPASRQAYNSLTTIGDVKLFSTPHNASLQSLPTKQGRQNIAVKTSRNKDSLNSISRSSRKRKRDDHENCAPQSNSRVFELKQVFHLSDRSPHLISSSIKQSVSPFLHSPFLPPPFSLSPTSPATNMDKLNVHETSSQLVISPAVDYLSEKSSFNASQLRRSRRLAQKTGQRSTSCSVPQNLSFISPVNTLCINTMCVVESYNILVSGSSPKPKFI